MYITSGLLTEDVLDQAFSSLTGDVDWVNGGFGGAPKFPPYLTLEFLLRYYLRRHDSNTLRIVESTLTKWLKAEFTTR